jgi:hypothetical protein
MLFIVTSPNPTGINSRTPVLEKFTFWRYGIKTRPKLLTVMQKRLETG